MDIRELTRADRDAAIGLWDLTDLSRPWNPPADDFDRAVAGPTSAVLGGFVDGALTATAIVGHDGHRGWIYYLAIHPEQQRTGLGRRMTDACERWLVDHGAVKVQLMVRHANAGATSFYERLGYRPEEVTVLSRWIDRPG